VTFPISKVDQDKQTRFLVDDCKGLVMSRNIFFFLSIVCQPWRYSFVLFNIDENACRTKRAIKYWIYSFFKISFQRIFNK